MSKPTDGQEKKKIHLHITFLFPLLEVSQGICVCRLLYPLYHLQEKIFQFCDDDALRVGPAYDPWVGGGLVGAGCAAPPFTRWRHQLGGSRILKGAQPPPAAMGCILKGTPCLNHPLPQGSRADATTKLTPLSKLTAFFKTCFQRESKL